MALALLWICVAVRACDALHVADSSRIVTQSDEQRAPQFSFELSDNAINSAFTAGWETYLLQENGEHQQLFTKTSSDLVEMLLSSNETDESAESTASWKETMTRSIGSVLDFEVSLTSPQVPRTTITADTGISLILTAELTLNGLLWPSIAVQLGYCAGIAFCPKQARRLHLSTLDTSVNVIMKVVATGTEVAFDLQSFAFENLDISLGNKYISGLSRLPGFGYMLSWLGTKIMSGADKLLEFLVDRFLRDLVATKTVELKDLLKVTTYDILTLAPGQESEDIMRFQDISTQYIDGVISVTVALYPSGTPSSDTVPSEPIPVVLPYLPAVAEAGIPTPTVVIQLSDESFNSAFAANYALLLTDEGKEKKFALTSAELSEAMTDGSEAWHARLQRTMMREIFTFEGVIGVPETPPTVQIDESGITAIWAVELFLNGLMWKTDMRIPLARLKAKASIKIEPFAHGTEISFNLESVKCHNIEVEMLKIASNSVNNIPGIGAATTWLAHNLGKAGNSMMQFAVRHLVKEKLARQSVELSQLLLLSAGYQASGLEDTLSIENIHFEHVQDKLVISAEIHRLISDPSLGSEWNMPRYIDMPDLVKHCLEVKAYKRAQVGESEQICVRDLRHAVAGCFPESVLVPIRPAGCNDFDSGVGRQIAPWAQGKLPGGECQCEAGQAEVQCAGQVTDTSLWTHWLSKGVVSYLGTDGAQVTNLGEIEHIVGEIELEMLKKALDADTFHILLQSLFDTGNLVGAPKDFAIVISPSEDPLLRNTQLSVYALFSPENVFHTVGMWPKGALAVRWELVKVGCPSTWRHRVHTTSCSDLTCVFEEESSSSWQLPAEACACEVGRAAVPCPGRDPQAVSRLIAAGKVRMGNEQPLSDAGDLLEAVGERKYRKIESVLHHSVLPSMAQELFRMKGLISVKQFEYVVMESSILILANFTADDLAHTLGHRPYYGLGVEWELQTVVPVEGEADEEGDVFFEAPESVSEQAALLNQEGLPWCTIEGSYRAKWDSWTDWLAGRLLD